MASNVVPGAACERSGKVLWIRRSAKTTPACHRSPSPFHKPCTGLSTRRLDLGISSVKRLHSPVPKRARIEAGARSRAAAVSVGPSSRRHAATASAPSSSIATTGPLVMNSGAYRWRPDYRSLTREGTVDSEWVTTPDA